MGGVIVGVFAATTVMSSMMSVSSSQGLFSLINLFQLYILLPMTGKYLPPKIIAFILGMDFTLFSLDFIPLEDIPYAVNVKEFFDYAQEDEYLNDIGLKSGSSFVNHLRLMGLFTFIFIFHLLIILLKRA